MKCQESGHQLRLKKKVSEFFEVNGMWSLRLNGDGGSKIGGSKYSLFSEVWLLGIQGKVA